MRSIRYGLLMAAVLALSLAPPALSSPHKTAPATTALTPTYAPSPGSFVLTATAPTTAAHYAPTFTGNGRLGIRVPPTGQGYEGGSVPTQAELAGFYAKPTHAPKASESVQQRASIPDWSALRFSVGGKTFSLSSGKVTGWRQSIDLRTGIITTEATWRAPDGRATRLRYQVLTDRADQWIGLVSLTVTPQWSGHATVTDLIDGSKQALSGGTAPSLTKPGASEHARTRTGSRSPPRPPASAPRSPAR